MADAENKEEEVEAAGEIPEELKQIQLEQPTDSTGLVIDNIYEHEKKLVVFLGMAKDKARIKKGDTEIEVEAESILIPKDSSNGVKYLREDQKSAIQGGWANVRPLLKGDENSGFIEKATRHVKRLGVRAWLRASYGVRLKFTGNNEEVVDFEKSTIPYKVIRDKAFFDHNVKAIEKSIAPDVGDIFEHGF